MSETFTTNVVADLAPTIAAIEEAAVRMAAERAARIAEVSGGAVETTPEQLAAIQANASTELFGSLREQLQDVAHVFTVTISKQ